MTTKALGTDLKSTLPHCVATTYSNCLRLVILVSGSHAFSSDLRCESSRILEFPERFIGVSVQSHSRMWSLRAQEAKYEEDYLSTIGVDFVSAR